MEKSRRFYLTITIPIICSVIIGVIFLLMHDSIGTGSKAALIVASERSNMSSELSALNTEIDTLDKDIKSYDAVIDANSTLLNEVNSLNTELEGYETDLENAKTRNAELNEQLSEKQAYLSGLSETAESDTEGTSRKLSAGEYKCPADLKKGRYRIEGNSTIYIYNIANSLTVREDLSTIDSHSYEFELSSGEKIKIDGDMTLTPIGQD